MWDKFMSKDTADPREERRKEGTGHQAIMRTIMIKKDLSTSFPD